MMDARVGIQSSLFILLGFIATVGNALVTVAIYRMKHRRLVGHYFIASLSLSDLYFGAFIMPMSVVELHAGATVTTTPYWCKFTAGLAQTAILGTSWNLVLITIDRFVSILKPLHYQSWFTERSVSVAIACTWFVVIVWSFIPMMGWDANFNYKRAALTLCIWPLILDNTYFTITLILIFVAISIVAVLQSIIFVVAQKHARVIHDNAAMFDIDRNKLHFAKRQRKITKIIAVIVGFFMMTYLPWMGILARNMWAHEAVNQIGILIGLLLVYLNSAANPWIYTLSDKKIFSEMKKAIPCIKNRTDDVQATRMTHRTSTDVERSNPE